jgi:hypothetical protein
VVVGGCELELTELVGVGVVRAPVATTAMQVASRILLVWFIVQPFPFLAMSAAYSSMLVAWSVTEVIRYSYFTLSLSGLLPGFLSWLRYNTFYVLYPLGISSECWLIYKAIEPAKALRQEYAWLLQLILFIYIPGKSTCGDYSGRVADRLRLVYSVYSYDGPEEKGYAREADEEDGLIKTGIWRNLG